MKLPSWGWMLLWWLSLCTFSVHAKCSDGVVITFLGWPHRLGRWWAKRHTPQYELETGNK